MSPVISMLIHLLQKIYEDVLQHEPMYRTLMENCEKHTETVKSKKERNQTLILIRSIADGWQKVWSVAKERRDNISRVLPIVLDHADSLKCVVEVVKQGEQTMNALSPIALDIEQGRKQLKKIRV